MRLTLTLILTVTTLMATPPEATLGESASQARTSASPARAGTIAGLHLTVAPSLIDVGENATFTATAKRWPAKSTALLSFISAHHGFTGTMSWTGSCRCFRLAVLMAKRIHPLEAGKAVVRVSAGNVGAQAQTGFTVRGLAGNGRDYAPGGFHYLQAWVSDPEPSPGQWQHYCAWVRTIDALGVKGMRIRFAVHFPDRTYAWGAGVTGPRGIVCSRRQLNNAQIGVRVSVDAYAGGMHARTSFVPKR